MTSQAARYLASRTAHEVLAAVERAYEDGIRELALLRDGEELLALDARARVLAIERLLPRLLRERADYLKAQQRLAELRLRLERHLGRWLREHVNHSGGGDRRSVSARGTAVGDLPEGVSRNQSSRYQKLAAISEETFEYLVTNARDTRRELTTESMLKWAARIRSGNDATTEIITPSPTGTVSDLGELIQRQMRFGTIYADPPWDYDNRGTRGAAVDHYPPMGLGELAALPLRELAADDCHLHLWTTNAFLFECSRLLAAWGFEYKSLFVWAKPQIGLGNYWRLAHELMLLGVRGRLPFRDQSQRSWQTYPRRRHSEKPEEVRSIIERVSPGPYLELFGRRTAPGWIVFGNQIERGLFDSDIPEIAG
jgi:N6-adenosine-specific RNA methylase IME4